MKLINFVLFSSFLILSLEIINDSEVTIDHCLPYQKFFIITEMKVEPQRVIKGDSVKSIVTGYAWDPYFVDALEVSIRLNGKEVKTDNVPIQIYLDSKEEFTYEYKYDIPTTSEPGNWQIKIYLKESQFDDLACTITSFTLE